MIRIGDHVEHAPTGDYLGKVYEVGEQTVRFHGPRTRDGIPVTLASKWEVQRCLVPPE